mgnify:CR=1 FL=1
MKVEDQAYKNYLEARDAALKMLEAGSRVDAKASAYYEDEMRGLEYMLDASPLIIKNLRHHCHHITGVKEYEYREHHRARALQFQKKLGDLKKCDGRGLFVQESEILGGFGFKFDGQLYNSDTLKYYECMLAMEKGGLLNIFRGMNAPRSLLEIGAGWGGLAYQFKKVFPKATYIIVDLPQSIIFSATYLKTAFPDAAIFISDGSARDWKNFNIYDYDFVFLPYYLWAGFDFKSPDLVINTIGFQEMSTKQIIDYVSKTKEWGTPYIYSFNRDRSPYNYELSTVSEVMKNFAEVSQIKILDVPYYDFNSKRGGIISGLKNFIKNILGLKRQGVNEYRHLVGKLN